MKVAVLGAGAWGTALAANIAPRTPTFLWARDPEQARAIEAARCNARYLPEIRLPDELRVGSDMAAALEHAQAGLVVIATPMAALAEMLARVGSAAGAVLWLCKGFERESGRLGHEVAASLGFRERSGVLSGPSFALEVARGQPTALVVASADEGLCEQVVEALHSESLRIYTSSDPVGVEVGGAVKNVLAIATGIADGMPARSHDPTGIADGMPARSGSEGGLGLNARAALITRGLAEMTRLGIALGGRAETFMGLSGLGDLVLTATGALSRNREVGLRLAAGQLLPAILRDLGHVAEGVTTAPVVCRRAAELGVEMPISEAVVAVLDGAVTPAEALERLMGRRARAET